MPVQVKRIYAPPAEEDGLRVLVDRLWPRGIARESARIDLWLKEIAPSNELRKWFGHEPAKWDEFKRRYFRELDSHPDMVAELAGKMQKKKITLIFSAKDEKHNNAAALKEYLEKISGRGK